MRLFLSRSNLVTALLFFFAFFFLSGSAKAEEKCTLIYQESRSIGRQYLYLTRTGFRMAFHGGDVFIVSKAPQWDVYLCNTGTGLYYRTTLQGWADQMAKFNVDPIPAPMRHRVWRPSGQTNAIAGMNAFYYSYNEGNAYYDNAQKKLDSGGYIRCGYYWVSSGIEVPQPVAKVISGVYGMPLTNGVSLRLIYRDTGDRNLTVLDTYKSEQVPLEKGLFDAPRSLRLAPSLDLVLLDKQLNPVVRRRAF